MVINKNRKDLARRVMRVSILVNAYHNGSMSNMYVNLLSISQASSPETTASIIRDFRIHTDFIQAESEMANLAIQYNEALTGWLLLGAKYKLIQPDIAIDFCDMVETKETLKKLRNYHSLFAHNMDLLMRFFDKRISPEKFSVGFMPMDFERDESNRADFFGFIRTLLSIEDEAINVELRYQDEVRRISPKCRAVQLSLF